MAIMWFFLSVFSALALSATGQEPSLPKVTINQGVVVGREAENKTHYEFFGIPYADSTSGGRRFKAPSAPPTFEDEFVADRKNIKCVRALGVGYEGTEDCLVLNILTPSLDSEKQLPVMVWLQGKELDNSNDPDLSFQKFMEKEVVIAHINYRESILGFLCLGTEAAPGNAGLKDIIAGLKWIQQNIAAFGGDPNNVILFGHGSGASAVDLITLSPSAQGLVHKAIAQSGTALAPWAVTRNNLKYAVQVAEALGHTVPDVETLSNVLSRTSVAALMATINELDLTDNSLAFAPCVERSIENVEAVLLTSPYQTILEGKQLKIPFMTGFVDNEGIIKADRAVNSDWLERMEESFEKFVQPDLDFDNEEDEKNVSQSIKTYYFGDNINSEDLDNFVRYNGDTMILISAIREARMRSASSETPVYLYQFSYSGQLSQVLQRPIPLTTAGHKEELVYMFYDEAKSQASESDLVIKNILIDRWTNFAKSGVPSSETSQTNWFPYTQNNTNYLRVLDDEEVNENENENPNFDIQLQNPHPELLVFWDNIYSKHFNDAQSRWSLNDRNEGDDNEDETGSGEGDGTDEENKENDEDTEGDAPGSASTAVAYTFSILAVYTLLDKFHMFQILS